MGPGISARFAVLRRRNGLESGFCCNATGACFPCCGATGASPVPDIPLPLALGPGRVWHASCPYLAPRIVPSPVPCPKKAQPIPVRQVPQHEAPAPGRGHRGNTRHTGTVARNLHGTPHVVGCKAHASERTVSGTLLAWLTNAPSRVSPTNRNRKRSTRVSRARVPPLAGGIPATRKTSSPAIP